MLLPLATRRNDNVIVRHARATRLLLLLLIGTARAAGAQTGPHEVWGAVGPLWTTERDAAASPLLYTGTGPSGAAGYAHVGSSARIDLQLDANSYGIAAVTQPSLPGRAELFRFGAQASYLRLIRIRGEPTGRWRLLAGAAVLGSGADRNERLQNGESRLYRNYLISFGPSIRLEHDLGGIGSLSYQGAVPLLNGITHPASDVRVLDDPGTSRLRWRGPASYRQVEQRLSYTRRIGVHLGVRTSVMSDMFADSAEPQRAGARTAAMVAGVIWLGSAAEMAR